jgi:hypothetical protein
MCVARHPRADVWQPAELDRSRRWRARVPPLSARDLLEPPQGLDVGHHVSPGAVTHNEWSKTAAKSAWVNARERHLWLVIKRWGP